MDKAGGDFQVKRDMNLIRLLLLETEGEEPKPDLSTWTEEQRVSITPRCSSKPVWFTEKSFPTATASPPEQWNSHTPVDLGWP
jgi:hypothetical protein